jgi:ribose/xylose/arabinose/galactoside ABC-type transport system permease subunit
VSAFGHLDPLSVPMSVWVMAVAVIVGDITLRRTGLGRRIYAIGSNQLMAQLAGIDAGRIKIFIFAVTGFLAALSGILVAARLERADTSIGTGWEFSVVASAIIGGVSLGGGIGTVAGAFLGLALLQVIVTGVVLIGVDPFLQTTVIGLAVIAAAVVDVIRHRRQG